MHLHLKQYPEKAISAFKRLRKRGFTLIELMVVITILAILSTVGISIYSGAIKRTNQVRIRSDLESLAKTYEIGFVPDAPNMSGGVGAYTALQSSDFAGGKIPVPPNSTPPLDDSYVVTGPDDKAIQRTDIGYLICADLDTLARCSTQPSPTCICKWSQKGETSLVVLVPTPTPTPIPGGGPTIAIISAGPIPVPKYEKFEITFDVSNSVATNNFFPYDNAPPQGIPSETGITVNAQFSNDGFAIVYSVPAFYYQEFEKDLAQPFEVPQRAGRDWLYPTGNFKWKVRFAPPFEGSWEYRLFAQDSSGTITEPPAALPAESFLVTPPLSKGFIKVSQDPRYFEYQEGTNRYFPALGYNMNWDHINWNYPIQNNLSNFQNMMSPNGIQFIRNWLSQWGIWSTYEVIWSSPSQIGSYPNYTSLVTSDSTITPNAVAPGSEASLKLMWVPDSRYNGWLSGTDVNGNPCVFLGDFFDSPAVKPNTNYRLSLRYRIVSDITGPAIAGQPFGFVLKMGGWLTNTNTDLADNWRKAVTVGGQNYPGQECAYPSALIEQWNPGVASNPLTPNLASSPYITANTNSAPDGWATIDADFITNSTFTGSNNNDFLPYVYLAIENAARTTGVTARVYIDSVTIKEDLGSGQYGPNVIFRKDFNNLNSINERQAHAFDKVLELARQNNVYFKLPVMEKNEFLMNSFYYDGTLTSFNAGSCANNDCFYGNNREMTKIRWLQKAWWRYMQARWGYSTNIHSWELLNEGDPNSTKHFILADEFGQFMHCEVFGIPVTDGQQCNYSHPNDHLVTTSFFSQGYPRTNFWANNSYPNLDYVSIHRYLPKLPPPGTTFYDTALAVQSYSSTFGAKTVQGVNKPVTRGETGLTLSGTQPESSEVFADSQGIWLRKYIWAQINPDGVIESYFYDLQHIYPSGRELRPLFKAYYDFIKNIPLNNNLYVNVAATNNDASCSGGTSCLRVLGQKDTANGKAHLWIDNTTQTWWNLTYPAQQTVTPTIVPAGTSITIPCSPPLLPCMPAGGYNVTWYNTSTGASIPPATQVNLPVAGVITINLPQDLNSSNGDIAIKVERQ